MVVALSPAALRLPGRRSAGTAVRVNTIFAPFCQSGSVSAPGGLCDCGAPPAHQCPTACNIQNQGAGCAHAASCLAGVPAWPVSTFANGRPGTRRLGWASGLAVPGPRPRRGRGCRRRREAEATSRHDIEPGAPGYDRVDWLPLNPSHRNVTASLAPISKENIIFSKKALRVVNREAQRVLDQILENPNPVFFMDLCRDFAQKAGFLSQRLVKVLDRVMDAGALGATQNMIGDAFHALVDVNSITSVVNSLIGTFPSNGVQVMLPSCGGPRYV